MPRISAVHAAHKAMTQRDGRAASLRCTGRRRASAGKAARRSVVLPYRRDMPARKRSTPEDTVTARRVLLDGLARDADIFELVSELAPLHPRDNTFPGEVFVRVVGRWVEPAELAGAALLLTDPASSYLTGVILPVDGGWTAH